MKQCVTGPSIKGRTYYLVKAEKKLVPPFPGSDFMSGVKFNTRKY